MVSVAEGGVEGGPKWPVVSAAATARRPRLSVCDESCPSAVRRRIILSHHLFSFVIIVIVVRSAKGLSFKRSPQIVSQCSIFLGKYILTFCDIKVK